MTQVSPTRYRQEPAYVVALASRLEGTAYSGPDGEVTFQSTALDTAGRGSAESFAGADLAITAKATARGVIVEKAILLQAKLGAIEDLTRDQVVELYRQIALMKRLTKAPKVMEIPATDGRRTPRIISGNRLFNQEPYTPLELDDYMVRRILPTLDGDTRPEFVGAVQDSRLPQLRVFAMLLPT